MLGGHQDPGTLRAHLPMPATLDPGLGRRALHQSWGGHHEYQTHPGVWKSQTQVPAGWFPWGPSSWCVDTVLPSCPHLVVSLCVCVPITSWYKDTSPTESGPAHTASFAFITSLKTHLQPIPSEALGLRTPTCEFGVGRGTQFSPEHA